MNPWLFIFLVSAVIYILVIDWQTLKVNVWAGLICALYALGTNLIATGKNLWEYAKVNDGLPQSIIFSNQFNIFLIGTVFLMGILFVQLLPQNMILQIVHACVWAFLYRLLFLIAEQFDMAVFIDWKAFMVSNIIPTQMLGMAWIKTNFLKTNYTGRNDS